MSFLAELRRRNVIRVGIAYCVSAWVVAQVAEFTFAHFGATWDMESTPNFAAKIEQAGTPWPPAAVLELPHKDW